MARRRKPYSKVKKYNQIRVDRVKNMGDKAFKGFQCLNPECDHFMFIPIEDLTGDFAFNCEKCGYLHEKFSSTDFYDYEVLVGKESPILHRSGTFSISHDSYIQEAQEYKNCIVCNTMKPLYLFDKHRARNTGRQGECRLCKKNYNDIKNDTRISEQHREAAQRRRLFGELAGREKVDLDLILKRFDNKCFKCGIDVSRESGNKYHLDHTLPVYYLWPLNTSNATILCSTCNGEKAERWPSEYYSIPELRELSIRTGIDFALLSGDPQYNPASLAKLQDPEIVDKILIDYAKYIDEIISLRNRLLKSTHVDMFSASTIVSQTIIDKANSLL